MSALEGKLAESVTWLEMRQRIEKEVRERWSPVGHRHKDGTTCADAACQRAHLWHLSEPCLAERVANIWPVNTVPRQAEVVQLERRIRYLENLLIENHIEFQTTSPDDTEL